MSFKSLVEFFNPEGGGVTIVTAILGGLGGAYCGFLVGGVGGAILGAVFGACFGFVLPYLLATAAIYAVGVLVLAAIIGAMAFVGWLISSLWGVGKP